MKSAQQNSNMTSSATVKTMTSPLSSNSAIYGKIVLMFLAFKNYIMNSAQRGLFCQEHLILQGLSHYVKLKLCRAINKSSMIEPKTEWGEIDLSHHLSRNSLRVDVSYLLCCTRKRNLFWCKKGHRVWDGGQGLWRLPL